MTIENTTDILNGMKKYYYKGETKNVAFRIQQLSTLKKIIIENEEVIIDALRKDLGRHPYETYTAEIGIVLNSISYHIRHIKKWSKVRKVKTPIHQLGATSYIQPEPYGVVLIVGPYNYPFYLLIEPMLGAMAAGNCVVVKPSEQTPTVAGVVNRLLSTNFNENYIRVIEGEKEVTSNLIHSPFDYIFFTGSVGIGKIVMEAASKNLVPVTLELGGKSPCIVDNTANIKVAAERIAWGKFFNAGQTCIAPDYLIVHQSIKKDFIKTLQDTITSFYGKDIKKSSYFARIVNTRHTNRLAKIIDKDKEKVIFGGHYHIEEKYISPTLIDEVTWDDACMQEELFGPIVPILEYNSINDVIKMINKRPKPLALYIFSEDKGVQKKILSETSSGGSCINDTISHITTHHLPFGGVGHSGMGSYHGKQSFKTFSHYKSILNKSTAFRMKMIFPPYTEANLNKTKKILK